MTRRAGDGRFHADREGAQMTAWRSRRRKTLEYWAAVWGAVVMISTGLVLWFEVPVLNRVPYWTFELFRRIHFYEATLAVLAIVVWHLYYVVVNPDVFPLNRAMTHGTLTAAEMERKHPLAIQNSDTWNH